jgi:hypothetical protein
MPHSPARRSSLEVKLLALLKQACSERKFDVADHLLCALECLAEEADVVAPSVCETPGRSLRGESRG